MYLCRLARPISEGQWGFCVSKRKAMASRFRGGYVLLSVGTISSLLWRRRVGELSAAGLRVYLSLHEMQHRRCDSHQKPQFLVREICDLTGLKERSISAGLRELRPFVFFDRQRIEFLSHFDGRAGEMVAELGTSKDRLVPVPRRLLRALAGHRKPSEVIASLVVAARCLFVKNGGITNYGFVKAGWIAEVFGIAKRTVFSATAWLRSLRLLRRRNVHWRVRNKFGQCYEILTGRGKKRQRRRESAPPWKNKRTISFGNTKTGVCIGKIAPGDLKRVSSVKILYEQACGLGWMKPSEANFLNVVAAAVRATTLGRNPAGLFVQLIRRGLWEFITAEQERRALRAVKKWRTKQRGQQRRDGLLLPAIDPYQSVRSFL